MFFTCRLAFTGIALGLAFASLPAAADHPRADRVFDRLDSNHDGKIDAGEMDAARAARFKRLDQDNDGVISAAEQDRAQNRIRRRAAVREARMARQFERLDADRDQSVSEDEFVATSPLGRADANQDGAVSREEFGAALSALRDRLPRR